MNLNNNLANIKAWGLRKKISISIITLLLLLGLTMVFITHTILLKVLKTGFQHKGISLSRSIAANSLVDVLTQNTIRLKKLVENEKRLDKDISYVFIIDSLGHILAHTFNQGFPVDLYRINNLARGREFNIETIDTQLGFIYDIAVGIFSEKSLLGQVHVGILQNRIESSINTISLIFICITILIIVIGIILAYKVSSLITLPISELVKAAQSIQKGDFSTHIDVTTKDEVGLLANAFNEMTSHLNLMVEEVKRLTTVKERNRIAFDLHDGEAQDLASIIKRIELCSKLFNIDPAKTLEELNTLKESTKDILNKTRKVIYDLKSFEDNDFDLLDSLTSYVKDYEKTNDIKVELDISGVNNIPQEKAKAIFYIIREAFSNIRKHAQAKDVELSLKPDNNGNLVLNIKDYGMGFNIDDDAKSFSPSYGNWGLISMRQRANSLGGTLVINSKPQQGTELSLNIKRL